MLCIILFIVAAVACSPPTGMAACTVYLDYSDQIPRHWSTVQVKTVLLVFIFSRNVKHFVCGCINSSFSTRYINSNISSQDLFWLFGFGCFGFLFGKTNCPLIRCYKHWLLSWDQRYTALCNGDWNSSVVSMNSSLDFRCLPPLNILHGLQILLV